MDNNTITNDAKAISNTFNNYYSSVGKKYAEQIIQPSTSPLVCNNVNFSFFMIPTNKDEVINVINSLKTNKTPGIDTLRAATLKEICQEIGEPLAE